MFTPRNISNDTMGGNGLHNLTELSKHSFNDSGGSNSLYGDGDAVNDIYEHVDIFEYIGEGVLLTSISVLGFLGSVLAINVLLQPALRGGTFSNILTGLATFDALFLATLPFTFGLPILSPYYMVIKYQTS